MSVLYDTMAGKVSDVSGSEEDDALSASDLESLARDAVMAAVDGRREPPAPPADETVVFGPGAKVAIMRGVMAATRELLSSQFLLSGPLKEAAGGVSELVTDTNALWKTLEEIDSTLATIMREPSVAVTAPAAKAEPVTDKIEPEPVSAAKTELVSAANTELVAAAEPKPGQPANAEPVAAVTPEQSKIESPRSDAPCQISDTPIVVNGLEVTFTDRTPEGFKSFLREFVEHISKGPVRPLLAHTLAKKHGWNVKSKGTISYQIDSYLGVLTKGKDEKGEAWWSLPGSNTAPTGEVRRA